MKSILRGCRSVTVRTLCGRPMGSGLVSLNDSRFHSSTVPTAPESSLQLNQSAAVSLGECARLPIADVEEVFFSSVAARTVSNAQLKRFFQLLEGNQYELAQAAARGAVRGGLVLNPFTLEALMEKLIAAGQLKASLTLYEDMIRSRTVPTVRTYNLLMEVCVERNLFASCEKLFNDMKRKGLRANAEAYELMITACAEEPVQLEKAIELFDSMCALRYLTPTAKTYTALMKVYLNMKPFDWRVVYNCYYELRHHQPPIKLEWDSYLLVGSAMKSGRAGWFRRWTTYCDAWLTTTPMFTVRWAQGVLVYLLVMIAFKSIIGTLITAVMSPNRDSSGKGTSDSLTA